MANTVSEFCAAMLKVFIYAYEYIYTNPEESKALISVLNFKN